VPGVTQFYPSASVIKGGDIYSGITADPYDPVAAASFLAAAGYNTGVAPPTPTVGVGSTPTVPVPPVTIGGGSVPSIATTCTTVTPPTPVSTTVSVPTNLAGNALTWSGDFPVTAAVGTAAGGFAVTLQQSLDSGKTWSPVLLGATTTGGYYTLTYSPSVTGTVSYRVFFTGLPETFLTPLAPGSPALPEAYVPPLAPGSGLPVSNTTATQYSAVSTYTIGTLGDVVNAITTGISSALTNSAAITNANTNNGLCNLEQSLATSINGALSTLSSQNTANANALKTSINGLGNSTNTALASLTGQSASKSDLATLTTNVGSLSTQVNSLNTQVNSLNSQIGTLQTVAYVALGVAVVLGLIAIALSMRKRSM